MSLKCVEIVGTSPAFGGHCALQAGFAVKVYEDRRDGGCALMKTFRESKTGAWKRMFQLKLATASGTTAKEDSLTRRSWTGRRSPVSSSGRG